MATPETGPGDAARMLGRRLDRFLAHVGRIPGWVWTLAALITVIWTYPRHLDRRVLVGFVLDDRLSIWISNLVAIGVLVVLAAVSLFTLRSVLHYMELGRWPKRAAGIEMDEMTRVEAQLHRDADELSKAADQTRMVTRALNEARETILYLTAELARARDLENEPTIEREKLAESE